ncbi:MAG: putative zinc-binding metallopeptidase [Gemmatimonadaceae bacterium]
MTHRQSQAAPWSRWSDERLLALRFRELHRSRPVAWVDRCHGQLLLELADRALKVRPHVWLAEEWFSPRGIPGFAIPFYLAHPRLMQLERTQMHMVEGGTPASCMAIMRHEAGHAIQHAHRLHRRARWRQLFGASSAPYPDRYRPRRGSRAFVHHIPGWYAQSHPDEDFAETFAVWLRPGSRWRTRYARWPVALAKLTYVSSLMEELRDVRPPVTTRARPHNIAQSSLTLGEHYRARRHAYRDVPSGWLTL